MINHQGNILVGVPSNCYVTTQPNHCSHCQAYQQQIKQNHLQQQLQQLHQLQLQQQQQQQPNPPTVMLSNGNCHIPQQICMKCLNERLANNILTPAISPNSLPIIANNNNLNNLSMYPNVSSMPTCINNGSQFVNVGGGNSETYVNPNMNSILRNVAFNRLTLAPSLHQMSAMGVVNNNNNDKIEELRMNNKIIYDSHDSLNNANAFNELPNFEAFSDPDGNVELYFKTRPKTIIIDIPCEFCEKFTGGTVSIN